MCNLLPSIKAEQLFNIVSTFTISTTIWSHYVVILPTYVAQINYCKQMATFLLVLVYMWNEFWSINAQQVNIVHCDLKIVIIVLYFYILHNMTPFVLYVGLHLI